MRIVFLGNFGVDYSSEVHHAKSLEALGHEVIKLQENEPITEVPECDLFVWVHTHNWSSPGIDKLIKAYKGKVPIVSYHLDLWFGLDRQKDLETDPFYKLIDHWFVTDKLMADWLNENTEVKGYYLPAGVLEEEAIMLDAQSYNYKNTTNGDKVEYFSQNAPTQKERPLDVVFVGSRGYHHEWQYRPQLIDWLKETYGEKFGHYSGEEGTKGLRRGLHLNQLYADAKIVVGDSLCLNFDYPYYWSDRVYETLGRGGFLIMPYIKGLDDTFEDGKHLVFYEFGDFKDLKSKIDFYLNNDQAREHIRNKGHELVKNHHTYRHRWETILETLNVG